ncbi:MAG: 8-amino-7-oxononanoate synthase [Gammaproteobacteria bacterium]|nr:8-amino-7-oxononanoate synthase [Gammaproteobacteria bacterium]
MSERDDLRARVAGLRTRRQLQARERVRRTVLRRDGVRCEVAGADGAPRWLVNFCSNDYLGLAQQFAVASALADAAARTGAGGVASHLVCGHTAEHEALERELADWLQAPRALLLGSGYMANLAVLQSLLGDGDVSVQDRLNHASLIDAAHLAGCSLRRYPHADPEGARRQLRAAPGGAAMLATDGVFSMDGDVAPLRELAAMADAEGALMYVDDAHGVGVLGPDGRGSVAAARLDHQRVPLQLVTLGKALGGYGAAVVGEAALVDHLAASARPYIYTTALPPALAAASLAAVKLARREHWRRGKLAALVHRLRRGLAARGFEPMESDTAIQPLPCGDDARALALSRALEARGYWVAAIRPPTVPEGRARLRITLTAAHSEADVDALVAALDAARDEVDAAPGRKGSLA